MPTWGEELKELAQLQKEGHPSPFDYLRRKHLTTLSSYTKRNIVSYSSRWTIPTPGISPELTSMTEEDIYGFMEVFHGLSPGPLDLLLHMPGGSTEAVEGLVAYVRSKFKDVRVIIPHAAMSAATMLACSANKIVMARHSFIGPIDPQLIAMTPLGPQAIPVQAIIDQFELAKSDCKNPELLGAWAPILPQYGPALVVQSRDALALSVELVSTWLQKYMFRALPDAKTKAETVATKLADHRLFKTHARHIDREQARSIGLVIDGLEEDQMLQDLVLSTFHATTLTFQFTPTAKIIENQLGNAYVRQFMVAPPIQPQGEGQKTSQQPSVPSG
ncbi:MAG: hypothetical protein LYZ69_03470 [Nitrososphaerales archaeon]|nr:hypothetical protein [Nitrososphaerales archaeon]